MEHLKLVSRRTKSADGGTSLLHKITKPTAWRGGVQILTEEEEERRMGKAFAVRHGGAKLRGQPVEK